MKKLVIHRKKQFRSSLMCQWIVMQIPRKYFLRDFLSVDFSGNAEECLQYYLYEGTDRLYWLCDLDEWGIPIRNGETLELEIEDSTKNIFVITSMGTFSNEIVLEPQYDSYEICVSTKGGWRTAQYPYLTLQSSKTEENNE